MFNSFTYQKPVVNYEQLMSALKDCPKDKIDEVVKRARSLGISEDYISQGLQIIEQIKSSSSQKIPS